MNDIDSGERRLRAYAEALSPAAWVVRLQGHAGISQLYEFVAYLAVPRNAPQPAFDKVLGANVAIELALPDLPLWHVHGTCAAFRRTTADPEHVHYELTLVPRLWLASQNLQSRVFQRVPLEEQIRHLLEPYQASGFETRIDFRHAHPVAEYSVQFQESDLAYLSRMLEDAGIRYYFQHERERHVLVICDDPDQHPRLLAGHDRLRFDPEGGTLRDYCRLDGWSVGQRLGPGKFTQRDFHFQMPTNHLEGSAAVSQTVAVGNTTHTIGHPSVQDVERYEYPGGVGKHFDGLDSSGAEQPTLGELWNTIQQVTQVRCQEMAAQALELEGTGPCVGVVPGHLFTLTSAPGDEGDYYVTQADYHVAAESGFSGGGPPRPLVTTVRFRCLPQDMPYRPPRVTPRPRVLGLQTARVVGPPGEELWLDKFGRVKVQFWWDRLGKNNSDSSCWVRVAQVWAGPRWGAFFWPRVGHEVVVAFVNGDPDHPLIVGSVYNAQNMPPLDLTEAKMNMITGIRSKIFGGDPLKNFNHVEFLDIPDQGQVQLHSEHHSSSHSEVTHLERNSKASFHFNGKWPGDVIPTLERGGKEEVWRWASLIC